MLQIAGFRRAPVPTLRVYLLHIATQLSIAKQTALLPKEQAVRRTNQHLARPTYNMGRGRASVLRRSPRQLRKGNAHKAHSQSLAREWRPPAGTWEEEIDTIDDLEDDKDNNSFIVYVTWKNGHRTKHRISTLFGRCPQLVRGVHTNHQSRTYYRSLIRTDASFFTLPHDSGSFCVKLNSKKSLAIGRGIAQRRTLYPERYGI